MKKITYFLILFPVILFISCVKQNNPGSPSGLPAGTATAVVGSTFTITPTRTITKTFTPMPSKTITRTRTASPTVTFTSTDTPTRTMTRTITMTRTATRTITPTPTRTSTPCVVRQFGSMVQGTTPRAYVLNYGDNFSVGTGGPFYASAIVIYAGAAGSVNAGIYDFDTNELLASTGTKSVAAGTNTLGLITPVLISYGDYRLMVTSNVNVFRFSSGGSSYSIPATYPSLPAIVDLSGADDFYYTLCAYVKTTCP